MRQTLLILCAQPEASAAGDSECDSRIEISTFSGQMENLIEKSRCHISASHDTNIPAHSGQISKHTLIRTHK